MSETVPAITSYAAFWPFYLHEHAQQRTRLIHIAGTTLAVLMLLKAIISQSPIWVLYAAIWAYGLAWAAHFLIEKNRPATWRYPLWSLEADFQLWWYWLTGRLEGELQRYNIYS